MAAQHGKNSKVTVNAATICVTNWSVSATVDSVESTSTCSGGFKEQITGLKSCTWDFTCNFDPLYNESAGVLSTIEEGDTVSLEFFTENIDTVPVFDAPTARVDSISISADVNGLITIAYSGVNGGEYAWLGEVTT